VLDLHHFEKSSDDTLDTIGYLSSNPVPLTDDGAGEASPSASRDKLVKNKKNKRVEQQERKPNAELVNLQPHSNIQLEDGISLSSQQKRPVARIVSFDKSTQYDCNGTLVYNLFHIQ